MKQKMMNPGFNNPCFVLYDADSKAVHDSNKIHLSTKRPSPRAEFEPQDIQNTGEKTRTRKSCASPSRDVPPPD